MSFLNVKNRASSTLASGILAADLSLTVAAGEGVKFPAVPFRITVVDEIMEVTAVATDVFTVTRAVEGTTAVDHTAGDAVELRITAGTFQNLERGAGKINVEVLAADKTLVAGTDPMYQYLDPNGASRIITLDTASAKVGDRFVIKNNSAYNISYYLQIKQSTTVLEYAYTQAIKVFIFNGTNWVAGDIGTGLSTDYNVAIGYSANGRSSGTAVGYGTYAIQGTAVGYNAAGYTHGTGVGYLAMSYNYGVAVGESANGQNYGISIGTSANGSSNGVAVGSFTYGVSNGISIGYQAGKVLTSYANPNTNVLLGYQAGLLLTQPSAWVASVAYTSGQYIRPSTANTYNYECTTAGTSGATEPVWNTTLGGTTTDGTAVWTTVSMRGNNNIIIGYDLQETANTADTLNIGNTIKGDLSIGSAGVGTVATLPTADVAHRGHFLRVEGASGVKDVLYICEKNTSDAYVWTAIT